jgi:hypothetical protein
MRFDFCTKLFKFLFPPPSRPPQVEGMATESDHFRHCINVKSRRKTDVQCPLAATHGEFCSRHYKNPHRFTKSQQQRVYTRSEHTAARKLQIFWRNRYALIRFIQQGPAANAINLATNDTELYTLDPITTITPLYFFSFADEKKNIWAFDIRSFAHLMAGGKPPSNPYTRESMATLTHKRLRNRLAWLRRRNYSIIHIQTEQLTAEQFWNQKVLDVFMKIEAFGYLVNCEWFQGLSHIGQRNLYATLFNLWYIKLGLTTQQKRTIVPGHQNALFKFAPTQNEHRDVKWWAKINLTLIDAFISRAEDIENRKLGATYVLMGLVEASEDAAEAFPWLCAE